MTISADEVNKLKRAPAIEGLLPLFLERWSPRSFADREVSRADLKRVFEAARWAPSSGNAQPWRFIVGTQGTETHAKLTSVLASFNKEWASKAPVLILGTTNAVNARGAANAYAMYDLGAAAVSITLAAEALGLATHQMAGFDHDAARREFGIPEAYALGSVMALGYQDEPAALANEELISRETAPRTRKPLSEMVFSAWDEPAPFD
ncbi:MAG TPA: nitroreductase family protein [Terracidiphilus sp.]|jgi:nitroreductase|nr:nitroreductase family protein [Terracidiphilus sp.]